MQLGTRGNDLPLTSAEFNDIMEMASVSNAGAIAVGVSGGGDSMALTYMLHDWCMERKIKLHALTVDHGLRDGSKAEAMKVGEWLKPKNIDHHILTWEGDKPDANIQDLARQARYGLLMEWCEKNGVEHLFSAHHKNDQAETFLIRLFRGSGVDGLSAMERQISLKNELGVSNVTLHRPLLDVPKSRLLAYLENENADWIEDPSNEDIKYTRIKIRELLNSTDVEGLDIDRLTSTADRMKRVRSLLEHLTDEAESQCVTYDPLGFARVNVTLIAQFHEELMLRLLANVLKRISGGYYPPRHDKLEMLCRNIQQSDFKGQTLMGAIILPSSENEIVIAREENAISRETVIDENREKMLWDKRVIVDVATLKGIIQPIDQKIVELVSDLDAAFKENALAYFGSAALRDRIMPSLPCIFMDSGQVKLPNILIERMNVRDLSGFSIVFKE